MEFIRCADCNAAMPVRSKKCPRCGQPVDKHENIINRILTAIGGMSIDVFSYLRDGMRGFIQVSGPSPSVSSESEPVERAMTADQFELILKRREQAKEPMRYGLISCALGVLGVFTLAVIFVPLAILFGGAGLIGSVIRGKLGAFLINLLAWVIIAWAFVVSPSLWLLVGLSAS